MCGCYINLYVHLNWNWNCRQPETISYSHTHPNMHVHSHNLTPKLIVSHTSYRQHKTPCLCLMRDDETCVNPKYKMVHSALCINISLANSKIFAKKRTASLGVKHWKRSIRFLQFRQILIYCLHNFQPIPQYQNIIHS